MKKVRNYLLTTESVGPNSLPLSILMHESCKFILFVSTTPRCRQWSWRQRVLILAQDGGEWSESCSSLFTPGERFSDIGIHYIEVWVDPRVSLDGVTKRNISAPNRYQSLALQTISSYLIMVNNLYTTNFFNNGPDIHQCK